MGMISSYFLLLLLCAGAYSQEFKDVLHEIFPPITTNTQIDCKFDVTPTEFDNGGYTLTWYKLQDFGRRDKDLAVSSGHDGGFASGVPAGVRNVLSFEMDKSNAAGPVNFVVKMTNVRKEDSGRYYCKATKNGVFVGEAVTGICVIFGPATIDGVWMYASEKGSNVDEATVEFKHQTTLRLKAGTPAYLSCFTVGTYPFPALTMTAGDGTRMTNQLSQSIKEIILVGDTDGDQVMMIKKVYSNKAYTVTAADHLKELQCEGKIIDPNSNELLISKQSNSVILLDDECANGEPYGEPNGANRPVGMSFIALLLTTAVTMMYL